MHVICKCKDGSDAGDAPAPSLDAHRDHLESAEVLRVAGLARNAQINGAGSIPILEADNIEAGRAFAASDPLFEAGVFKEPVSRPSNQPFAISADWQQQ